MVQEKNLTNVLNVLLREELSAVDTYEQVLERLEGKQGAQLEKIRREHEQAARMLKEKIKEDGAPVPGRQAWSTVAAVAAGTGNPLNDPMAIKALKEGETQVILSYETTLNNDALDSEARELIKGTLLPQARAHLPVLDKLLAAA